VVRTSIPLTTLEEEGLEEEEEEEEEEAVSGRSIPSAEAE
jgi:hypothetical protein